MINTFAKIEPTGKGFSGRVEVSPNNLRREAHDRDFSTLQAIAPLISKTTLRQMGRIIFGILAMTGRITMLGISRWTEVGGSYRTIQRFYHTVLPWAEVLWILFAEHLWKATDEYILAGDEVVVSKAGQETFGLDRFFSSLQQRPISAISFFVFSLVSVQERQSYPIKATQIMKSAEEKAVAKIKKEQKKVKAATEKKPRGRPKGSKNKNKQEVVLNSELLRIQAMLRALLLLIRPVLGIKYMVMDGHFGNSPSAWLARQENLHLISKIRSDAALYPAFEGEYSGSGRPAKYGAQVDVRKMNDQYLKETAKKDNIRTDIYQATLYNKESAFPLNVVVILKTNLTTHVQSQVILFSTDPELAYDKMIEFYCLRFQIEFNFRDAKQYWGLEDFMNVKETTVTNAELIFFYGQLELPLAKAFSTNQSKLQHLGFESTLSWHALCQRDNKNASAKT